MARKPIPTDTSCRIVYYRMSLWEKALIALLIVMVITVFVAALVMATLQ